MFLRVLVVRDISLKTSTPDLVDINETTVTGKKAGLALIKVTVSGDANHEEASTMVAAETDCFAFAIVKPFSTVPLMLTSPVFSVIMTFAFPALTLSA